MGLRGRKRSPSPIATNRRGVCIVSNATQDILLTTAYEVYNKAGWRFSMQAAPKGVDTLCGAADHAKKSAPGNEKAAIWGFGRVVGAMAAAN